MAERHYEVGGPNCWHHLNAAVMSEAEVSFEKVECSNYWRQIEVEAHEGDLPNYLDFPVN